MKERIECTDCVSAKCFVKKYCSGEQLISISKQRNQNLFEKGDFIFREGNLMTGIHFILHGGVKVVTPSMNGVEQVVRLVSDGGLLGHRVLGNDKYYFNAIALMDTQVCFLETSLFRDICMENSSFAYNLILFYALELRRTELRVKYISHMSVHEKVAEAFVYLNEIFGTDPKTKTLNLALSRQEIGDMVGLSREQVTRQLKDFEDEKFIKRKKREIQITNIKGLEKIVWEYKIS